MRLLPPAGPPRPEPEPLEVDDPRLILGLGALWLVGLLVLVVLDLTGTSVPGWQMWTCVAGAGLGVLGTRTVRRRARRD